MNSDNHLMPNGLGETIATVFAGGDLFARPASYEIMLDVPSYLVMASGRVFRLFGESFREVSRTDGSFLDAQKDSSSFPETKSALSILCGKRILDVLPPFGRDGLLLVLDEGLTLECLYGVLEEFSIIRVFETINGDKKDEPLQILFDELASQGKTWEEAREIAAGIEGPEDQLDLAEWLANHRGASRSEMLTEKHRLMKSRMKA